MMINFTNTHFRFDHYLQDLAERLHVPLVHNCLRLPSHIGTGYLKALELPNGLWTIFQNLVLNVDFHLERPAQDDEVYYTVRFEEIDVSSKFITTIDGDSLETTSDNVGYVFLTCSIHELEFIIPKGTGLRVINIRVTREWLARYLHMDTYDGILQEYLSLKTAALHMEPLDAVYKQAMNDIWEVDDEHPAFLTIVNNRVMSMMERFFTNLYESRMQLRYHVRASNDDIQRIREIEAIITRDITEPCPTIEVLSKKASMSPSKLKQLFKQVYGKPLYQYYQHFRMLKARSMLLTKKYSVKEVGMSLGYSNLSNFSTAFRKSFGILPSELGKE
jgi:AraC-like DNA-binding protein